MPAVQSSPPAIRGLPHCNIALLRVQSQSVKLTEATHKLHEWTPRGWAKLFPPKDGLPPDEPQRRRTRVAHWAGLKGNQRPRTQRVWAVSKPREPRLFQDIVPQVPKSPSPQVPTQSPSPQVPKSPSPQVLRACRSSREGERELPSFRVARVSAPSGQGIFNSRLLSAPLLKVNNF